MKNTKYKYQCEVCGRKLKKKIRIYGKTVCSKHMHQLFKYGKTLDSNPRTQNDPNDYIINGDVAIFNVYNVKQEKVAEFSVDKEDAKRIQTFKWRIDVNNRIVTGNCTKKQPRRDISYVVLDMKPVDGLVIDHIDGNPLNNQKSNLRVTTQSNNVCNKTHMSNSSIPYIGVAYDKSRKRWAVEISKNHKRYRLKRWKTIEEACYARLVAAEKVFGEYHNCTQKQMLIDKTKNLSSSTKKEIEKYVNSRLDD